MVTQHFFDCCSIGANAAGQGFFLPMKRPQCKSRVFALSLRKEGLDGGDVDSTCSM